MSKPIKYPKTGQYRNVITDINHQAAFQGMGEDGEPIYDNHAPKPTNLMFTGTVKLHGTNASITYNPNQGLNTQSRNGRFDDSQLNTHMGFTQYALVIHRGFYQNLLSEIFFELQLDPTDTLVIYGEWAGKGIQKGVAISELPKAFYYFGTKIKPVEGDSYWVVNAAFGAGAIPTSPEHSLYNLWHMWTRVVNIDFNRPEAHQNALIQLTNQVEKECPIAHIISEGEVSGVGEGIVWVAFHEGKRYTFKVKGEKHSSSNTKQLAEVDPIKLKATEDFVDYAVTPNRVAQGIQEANPELDIKKTGDFIRWVVNDIMAEESDVLVANDLEWKDVAKYVSTRARQMMMKTMDSKAGL